MVGIGQIWYRWKVEFPRDALTEALKSLAEPGVYAGTSSWKYEGWLGITAERLFVGLGRCLVIESPLRTILGVDSRSFPERL